MTSRPPIPTARPVNSDPDYDAHVERVVASLPPLPEPARAQIGHLLARGDCQPERAA